MKTIFSTIVGSRLYGISTETSDTDIKGFGFPPIDALIGLNKFEQQTEKSETEESCIYTVGKFLFLCYKGNPTVLEVAFTNKKFHLITSAIGLEVCEFAQQNLLTKALFKPYSAYFRKQVCKLDRPERFGKRQVLIDKYGFDTKFAAHAYRLGTQCKEIMVLQSLNPTLGWLDQKICRDIREGLFSKEQVKGMLSELDTEMYDAYQASKLSEKPDFHKVNDFIVDIHLRYLKGEFDDK